MFPGEAPFVDLDRHGPDEVLRVWEAAGDESHRIVAASSLAHLAELGTV